MAECLKCGKKVREGVHLCEKCLADEAEIWIKAENETISPYENVENTKSCKICGKMIPEERCICDTCLHRELIFHEKYEDDALNEQELREDHNMTNTYRPESAVNVISSGRNLSEDNQYRYGVALCIAGIIFGLIILILGIAANHTFYLDHTGDAIFGGDFYTYIYEATQNAANNVADVARGLESVAFLLKALMIGFGGFISLISALSLVKLLSNRKHEQEIDEHNAAVLQQMKEICVLLEKQMGMLEE